MPEVYELHLRRRASPTKDSEYVLFAERVLENLQVGGRKRSSISRAVTITRSGPKRRRNLLSDDVHGHHSWCWEYDLMSASGLNWKHVPHWRLPTLLNDIEARGDSMDGAVTNNER
jgi:hypothetical protein